MKHEWHGYINEKILTLKVEARRGERVSQEPLGLKINKVDSTHVEIVADESFLVVLYTTGNDIVVIAHSKEVEV